MEGFLGDHANNALNQQKKTKLEHFGKFKASHGATQGERPGI